MSGTIKLPAVPSLLDYYLELCSQIFLAAGRGFSPEERASAHELLGQKLRQAFAGSQRSKLVIQYQAASGAPLGYEVQADIQTVGAAYETWIGPSAAPLFGSHPDARVLALAREFSDPGATPVLDVGAGTGRNALALARLGHPVDAVEMTPKFAELLRAEAARQQLEVRVIERDVFATSQDLAPSYRLLLLSEVVPDFRDTAQLRRLFELATEVLAEDGALLFNVHLAAQGYTPDRPAREFAQQCYSALFTRAELTQAAAGLGLELVADDSVYDYERQQLPDHAWPPTTWYANWVSGQDVYELEREGCPVEMRWLVYRKTTRSGAGPGAPGGRARRFDPERLRQAVIRRLQRRAVAAGSLTLPAVPGMLDQYLEACVATFGALGRKLAAEELAEARSLLGRMLREAYASSGRSNVVVGYQAPMGSELTYEVTVEALSLTAAYEGWLDTLPAPLFGAYPDARVTALAEELGDRAACRVLDLGAGTGRNALALARLGHPVDAIELVPRFAELIRAEAAEQHLSLRVTTGDLFDSLGELRRQYRLIVAAGVASDFRELAQLRRLFELGAERLAHDGRLLLSAHVAFPEYAPDETTRQWAEQCCATFYTRDELGVATAGLPLELVEDESAYAYEHAHLPAEAWPPTPVYPEWARALHLHALAPEQCPIELRWLVYRKAISDRQNQ